MTKQQSSRTESLRLNIIYTKGQESIKNSIRTRNDSYPKY